MLYQEIKCKLQLTRKVDPDVRLELPLKLDVYHHFFDILGNVLKIQQKGRKLFQKIKIYLKHLAKGGMLESGIYMVVLNV